MSVTKELFGTAKDGRVFQLNIVWTDPKHRGDCPVQNVVYPHVFSGSDLAEHFHSNGLVQRTYQ